MKSLHSGLEPKFHDPSEGLLSLGYAFVYEYSEIILSKSWLHH